MSHDLVAPSTPGASPLWAAHNITAPDVHRSCPIGRHHHLDFTSSSSLPPIPHVWSFFFLAALPFHCCGLTSCSHLFSSRACSSTVVSLTFATPRSVVCCFPLRSFIESCGKETLPGSYSLIRDGYGCLSSYPVLLFSCLSDVTFTPFISCAAIFPSAALLPCWVQQFIHPHLFYIDIYCIILTFEVTMAGNNGGNGQMIEYIQGTCVICFDPARLGMTASCTVSLGLIINQHIQIVCTLPPTTPRQTREHLFPSRWSSPSPPASAPREPTPVPPEASAATPCTLRWRIPCSTMHFMQTLARTTLVTSTALRCISTRSLGTPQTVIVR